MHETYDSGFGFILMVGDLCLRLIHWISTPDAYYFRISTVDFGKSGALYHTSKQTRVQPFSNSARRWCGNYLDLNLSDLGEKLTRNETGIKSTPDRPFSFSSLIQLLTNGLAICSDRPGASFLRQFWSHAMKNLLLVRIRHV